MTINNDQFDFSEVDALKNKLDKLRPLDAIVYNKILHKFHIDWTYNSNAIEGNTLTYSETQFYLNFGLTSKGHTLSEYLEMKNHQKALQSLERVIKDKTPISQWLIKNFHAILFENNEGYEIEDEKGAKMRISVMPGQYKKHNNYVLLPDGGQKWYMDPLLVIDGMENLIKFYEDNKEIIHPILLAAELHARFVNIHPFVDGNGRTARLIMNIVLMQDGYSPAIIQNAQKQDYYDALQKYDETKDLVDFIAIIEKEVIRTLQIMLNAAGGKAVFDEEDITKRLNNFSQSMEALDKDVGKITKKISMKEKAENIKKLRDYFYRMAEKRIKGFDSGIFKFSISPKLAHAYYSDALINYLKKKNIAPDMQYKPNDEAGFEVGLRSNRSFIPTSYCSFIIIPTKYTLCVCYTIEISEEIKSNSRYSQAYNFIQNGILFEDWHKQDLDNFFNDVFEQFLGMVEHEAELCRVRIEEQKENNQ